jgi:intracellular sulfur oxidation DsrE/DsrF family protein
MDMRALACIVLTVASSAFAAPPAGHPPLGPNLFVADGAFTIEQAVADAAAQRTPQDPPTWKLLVADSEARRLLASSATPATMQVISQAQASGARVFVCAKDLKALDATPQNLIPGVHAVRGYLTADAQVPDWERRLPWAPDRKSLAICGGT